MKSLYKPANNEEGDQRKIPADHCQIPKCPLKFSSVKPKERIVHDYNAVHLFINFYACYVRVIV